MIRTSDNSCRIPARLNAAIIAIQLLLFGVSIATAARMNFGWELVLVAVGFAILMNSVYSIIHEAEHAMLFSNRCVNDCVGVFMALLFPAPFHLLRQGHIGHHLRNRSDDEAFDLYFEGESVVWRWMTWFGILTGLYYVMVVLANPILAVWPRMLDRRKYKLETDITVDRHSVAFLESFNPAQLRWIRLEALAAIALHVGLVWGLDVPVLHYLLLYGAFGFAWSAMQYVHHYDTERHITRGTRDLWIWGPIDALLLNHNWHRAHHENPTVPWVHLPRLTRERADGSKRGFLIFHYFRMWRGPRKAETHVENKYAGRIIQ